MNGASSSSCCGSGLVSSDAGQYVLPGLVQKLRPSVQAKNPRNRVVVAFPVNWRWVVRSYPYPGPKEFDDLTKALLPPSNPPASSTK
jgi:hypothetical protein